MRAMMNWIHYRDYGGDISEKYGWLSKNVMFLFYDGEWAMVKKICRKRSSGENQKDNWVIMQITRVIRGLSWYENDQRREFIRTEASIL